MSATYKKLFMLAIVFAVMAWLIESILAYFLIYNIPLIDVLTFKNIPHNEIYIRVVISSLFIIFALAAASITGKKQKSGSGKQEPENKYEEIFSKINAGFTIYKTVNNGEDFIITEISKGCEKNIKINKADMINKSVREVYPASDSLYIINIFKRVNSTGIPEIFIDPLHKNGGISAWCESYIYKLPSGEILAVYEDITQKKEAELLLRKNHLAQSVINSLLRLSLDPIPIEEFLQCALELIFSISWFPLNSSGCIFMKEGNQLLIKAQKNLSEKVMKSCSTLPIGKCLCGKSAETGELIYTHSDDSRHEIHLDDSRPHSQCCIPILSSGQAIGVINLYIDDGFHFTEKDREFLLAITNNIAGVIERKKTEQALRQERDFSYALIQTSPAFFVALDINWNVVLMNSSMLNVLGYKPNEIFNRNYVDICIPDYEKQKIKETFEEITTFPGKNIINENHVLAKDGRQLLVEWRNAPVFNQSNKLDFFFGIGIDITERRQIEQKLAEERRNLEQTVNNRTKELRTSLTLLEDSNIRLAEALKHKSQFLTSISHELRTPLTAILGFNDLLKNEHFGSLNAKQSDFIFQIDNSGRHLLSLINDILDIIKIDSGTLKIQSESFYINEIIDSCLKILRNQLEEKQLQIAVNIEPGLGLLNADKTKCRQILLNLLTNAIKFTKKNGHISIKANNSANNMARIEVVDTGIGIAKENFELIFSEFYQTEYARTNQSGGSGIGLALCRRLVNLHGGEIGVESEINKGSCFWFTLPLGSKTVIGNSRYPSHINPTRKTILIAENNEINLKVITEALKENFNIVIAIDEMQIIEAAKLNMPCLVLIDIQMAKIDNHKSIQQLRENDNFKQIPIIIMASESELINIKDHKKYYNDIISKPFTIAALLDTLHQHLNKDFMESK